MNEEKRSSLIALYGTTSTIIFNLKGKIQVSMIKYKRILNCNDPEMEMVETD